MITSIIILTYNKLELTKMCIESIRQYTTPGTYEIIIVDNNSTDDTVAWLQQQSDLRVIYNQENKGFPGGCNQGIDIAIGDNIMLLNNDVIVTANWLDNLVHSLYSADDIGAVGPITNYCAYYQTMPVSYQSIEEMQAFAANFNQLDPAKWEERLKLIGYCMLIRGDVAKKVGHLDEIFTPGNFEDDDYSVRIRREGYRLLFCKDTFIHHFGSMSWRDNIDKFTTLLHVNEQKFQDKWGYNSSQSMLMHLDMIELINKPTDQELNVLELNCGAGGTLLKIKDLFKQAHLYGVEKNEHAAREAQPFANIHIGASDEESLPFPQQFFDVILLPNVLEFVQSPQTLLQNVSRWLRPGGQVIAKVRNVTHVSLFQRLMSGQKMYDQEDVRYYSYVEINNLFTDAGFSDLAVTGQKMPLSPEQQRLSVALSQNTPSELRGQYEITQFLIVADTERWVLSTLLQRLIDAAEEQVPALLEQINAQEPSVVIGVVERLDVDPVKLYNRIAQTNFLHHHFDDVLPYLQRGIQLQPENDDTLFNLGYVLQMVGNQDLALHYLEQIKTADNEVQALVEQIKVAQHNEQKFHQALIFLLHRIEFDVDQADSALEVTEALQTQRCTVEDVLRTARLHSVELPKVLNPIAVTCFQQNVYEPILPLLQAALESSAQDTDTLYNLGVVLHAFGEARLSLAYLQQIENPDVDTQEMISAIKGELSR